MKVTILRITHKHGVNYYVHLTREAARQELVKWVKEWWPKELPDEPIPEDEQEMIDVYFELGPPTESWEMTPDEEAIGLPENNRWAIYDFDDETMLAHVYDDYEACAADANELDNSMIVGFCDGRYDSDEEQKESAARE